MSRSGALGLLAATVLIAACATRPAPVAVAPPELPPMPAKADRVLVLKGERALRLLAGSRVLRSYRIALGSEPEGPKRRERDGRTPEGSYTLTGRNPCSSFHRSIRISYPDRADRERAAGRGVDPGGDIVIHGLPDGKGWIGADHARHDWTQGCIAVTNAEMDKIWSMVDDGTPIEIRP